MNRNRQIISWLILLTVGGCGRGEKSDDLARPEAIAVEVVSVVAEEIERSISVSGSIRPWRQASLGAAMPGKVERMMVEVGDVVDGGELLVEMGGEQLTQAAAQLTALEKDWKRMRSLFDKGVVTQQAFDQVDAAHQGAKAGYELVLASTRVRAPFAGVVTEKYLEEGEVFTLFPGPAGSPALLRLEQVDTVNVVVSVPEVDIPEFQAGQAATLRVDAYPGRSFTGEVFRIEPSVDERTRTAEVEIRVANPERSLRVGMFADVSISVGEEPALLLPRDGLIRQVGTGIYYVFKVVEGEAQRSDVEVGRSYAENVAILTGLAEGDTVIVVGKTLVQDGCEVQVVSSGRSER
ncbi:MAG: efflux RND transporter periplasmic adaptor subunit [Candidatus Eisenbacteria sp.]|nr:efflux RND transporter periplasmic adaptor subunit [Candidatus Eisenbacteria bacterium]